MSLLIETPNAKEHNMLKAEHERLKEDANLVGELTDSIASYRRTSNELATRVAQAEIERDRLRAELGEAVAQLGMANGVLTMTVARLGGVVEGNPTGRHNFLQRIDELVQQEARHEQDIEAAFRAGRESGRLDLVGADEAALVRFKASRKGGRE